jgi:hypothetical protein
MIEIAGVDFVLGRPFVRALWTNVRGDGAGFSLALDSSNEEGLWKEKRP